MRATEALQQFADAMKAIGVPPSTVEVILPVGEWKELDGALAEETAAGIFESVGLGGRIEIGGVRYLVKFAA